MRADSLTCVCLVCEWATAQLEGLSRQSKVTPAKGYNINNIFFIGILTQRWRLLLRPINASPHKVTVLTKAMCVLHNYLRHTKDGTNCPVGYADSLGANGLVSDGFWRQGAVNPLDGLALTSRSMTTASIQLREKLADYFVGNGSVDWQLTHIRRRN